jgi:hypothetical protein
MGQNRGDAGDRGQDEPEGSNTPMVPMNMVPMNVIVPGEKSSTQAIWLPACLLAG